MPVIGLDLGGTKLAGALFSDEGHILERSQAELAGRGGEAVGEMIGGQAEALLASAARRGVAVRAVGASVPGIYHAGDGTVWAPNIAGWERFPLRGRLARRIGPEIAVAVDSDRACSILGEATRGAARGCRHAVFLAVGTGIGAGILIDGRVLRGAHDIAGAIGWMGLDRPYRADYDACGCFETHASGAGIERKARRMLAERPGHAGPLAEADPAHLSARDVFAAEERGDPIAREIVGDAVECWGMAAANLVSLFDPEVVVFGGGVFGPAGRFLDRIAAEARRWGQPVSMTKVAIRLTELGPEACLVGTGQMALGAGRG